MSNTRQYRYFHKGDNEWLDDRSNSDDKEWQEAWEVIRQDTPHPIVFTEDMYTNSEYADIPEFINVTIKDDYILQFKMARGVIKAIEGASYIVFVGGIDCYTDDGWGNISSERISISPTGAWVTISAKHSSEEVEVDITEQFNQAIGETA